jgi:hypothetical protein
MDHYEKLTRDFQTQLQATLIHPALEANYPVNTNNPIFNCYLDE